VIGLKLVVRNKVLLDRQIRKIRIGGWVRPQRNLTVGLAQLQVIHNQRRLLGAIDVEASLVSVPAQCPAI
jgi:hypothetical protein